MSEEEKILKEIKKGIPEEYKETISKLIELNKKLKEVKNLGDKISLYRGIEKETQDLSKKIVRLRGIPSGNKEFLKSLLNRYCIISKENIK